MFEALKVLERYPDKGGEFFLFPDAGVSTLPEEREEPGDPKEPEESEEIDPLLRISSISGPEISS